MAIDKYIVSTLPREKAKVQGVESLSDVELIALILRSGIKNIDVLEISEQLLNIIGTLNNIVTLEYNDLLKINGIGPVKALEVQAIIQLLKRINRINKNEFIYIQNPDKIFELYQKEFEFINQEHFVIISLNAKNAIIDEHTVFVGTLSQSLIHPREIFRQIIIKSAASFICIHNHPSGDSSPSENDFEVTKHLNDISNIFGIPMLDHIIIGRDNYFSFKENNYL